MRIALADIEPLRAVSNSVRRSRKFAQILSSVRAVGLVEPLVVAAPREGSTTTYTLLDGHLRHAILKDLQESEAQCLIATDEEPFTYNYRVSRLSTVREHRMMLKAVEQGVSPDRLAHALNVDIGSIKRKTRLLDKVCAEAVALLEDKHVSVDVFRLLKRMIPERQLAAAELMVAMNRFTVRYARALLAATPDKQLVPGRKSRRSAGITPEQMALVQRESANVEQQFKLLEQSYGADQLDLVLARSYLARAMSNPRVALFLEQHYAELYMAFIRLSDDRAAA